MVGAGGGWARGARGLAGPGPGTGVGPTSQVPVFFTLDLVISC